MAHWRDGGIGNMAGSDDRQIEEWTLLEKLAELASTPMGAPIPRCLGSSTNIAEPISKIAQDAFDEIQRLRGGYPADLGDAMVRLRHRAAGYESLLGEPQWSPMRAHVEPDITLMREAANEIERLREAVEPAARIIVDNEWRPIDTVPVEPAHTVPSYYRFRCMLQDAQGDVFEGAAYFVKPKPHLEPVLRWRSAANRQCFPKFWKPLPLPKKTENGGEA